MMMLAAIAFIPTGAPRRTTAIVNAVAVAELAIAWVQSTNRPIVVEWLGALMGPFGR